MPVSNGRRPRAEQELPYLSCIAAAAALHPFFGIKNSFHVVRHMSKQAQRLAMTQWDVFSSNPLEGNSLAVFSDARGLSDAEMQAIAKEMNLSETTFILPR